jgi:hypothetical protein
MRIEKTAKNTYWAVYKNLEKEINDLTYVIQFNDAQLLVYSNKIADLLVCCAIQIEALFLALSGKNKIGDAISDIASRWNIENKCVKIVSHNMYFEGELGIFFAPMEYGKEDDNDYYSAFCAIKHNRDRTLYKANLNMLIRAMAALFILNVYYRDRTYYLDELDEFDPSHGSDIFIVMYGNADNTELLSNVILIIEDLNYVKKVEEWVDVAPIDSSEFLKYEKSNPPPKRYKIALNKMSIEEPTHE